LLLAIEYYGKFGISQKTLKYPKYLNKKLRLQTAN
jgi:hypothetical protein